MNAPAPVPHVLALPGDLGLPGLAGPVDLSAPPGDRVPGSLVAEVFPPADGDRDLQPTDVTPGVLGFSVIFGVALLVILIALAMTGSLRRVNHRRDPQDDPPGTTPGGPGDPGETGPRRAPDPDGDRG